MICLLCLQFHHLRPQPQIIDQPIQLLVRQPSPLPGISRQCGFHHVGTKGATPVTRRGRDDRFHPTLSQQLDVFFRSRIGNHGLAVHALGHVLAHEQEVARDQVRAIKIFCVLRFLLRPAATVEDHAHWEVTDDWQHDPRHAFKSRDAINRDRDAQRNHQIS